MSKKNWIVLIIVLVLIVIGVWVWQLGSGPVDEEAVDEEALEEGVPAELGEDMTSDIEDQLEGIDLGDLESEFEDIDAGLEEL